MGLMSVDAERGNGLPHVFGFSELAVYQKARELQVRIFEASGRFPKAETFSLTDQVRRSSRSVGAQIAEAWAKRRYEHHFVSKLTDALGELNETEHWIETSQESGYLRREDCGSLLELSGQIGRMLSSMITRSEQFCTPSPGRLNEPVLEPYLAAQFTDH